MKIKGSVVYTRSNLDRGLRSLGPPDLVFSGSI